MGTKTRYWLQPGEQIIFYGEQDRPRRPIRFILITLAIMVPLKAFLIVWAGEYTNYRALIVDSIDEGSLLACAILFILIYQRSELVLTGDRLIIREGGLFFRTSGEVPIAEISKATGDDIEDGPFELEFNNGESIKISKVANLGRLRNTLEELIAAR